MVHVVRWEIKTYCQSFGVFVVGGMGIFVPYKQTRMEGLVFSDVKKKGKDRREEDVEVFMCFDIMIPQIH